MKLLVLGGYGYAGTELCRAALTWLDADLMVAGRNGARARAAAAALAGDFPGRTIDWAEVDAGDKAGMIAAFDGVDIIAVVAPIVDTIATVAEAALAAGADLIDILVHDAMPGPLEPLAERFAAAGRQMITQAGVHPGLPAAMVRAAAPGFDVLRAARIGMAFRGGFDSAEAVAEVFGAVAPDKPALLENGVWRKAGWRDTRLMEFGPGFGRKGAYPLPLLELTRLEMPGLTDLGLFAAGFNWFVDWIVFPAAYVAAKIRPGLGTSFFARAFVWGADRFDRGPPGIVLRLEAEGEKDGAPRREVLELRGNDGMVMTGQAVAAVLGQYRDGVLGPPGLKLQALCVDPGRMIADLEKMGVTVRREVG